MPRCKSCGTVYSSVCDACPKCSCPTDEEAYAHETENVPEKTDYRSWIFLVIGICAFIGVIFLIFSLMSLI